MTAPAAPVIRARQNGGGLIRVSWLAVATATDYNLYMGAAASPTGLEDSIPDDDALADGTFEYWTVGQPTGPVWLRLTALNVLAEESAYSNEIQVNVRYDTNNVPTAALRHVMKLG